MEISYDKEADAFAIWFKGVISEKTVDVTEDIFVDVDSQGRLAGIEVLHASTRTNLKDLESISTQFPPHKRAVVSAERGR